MVRSCRTTWSWSSRFVVVIFSSWQKTPISRTGGPRCHLASLGFLKRFMLRLTRNWPLTVPNRLLLLTHPSFRKGTPGSILQLRYCQSSTITDSLYARWLNTTPSISVSILTTMFTLELATGNVNFFIKWDCVRGNQCLKRASISHLFLQVRSIEIQVPNYDNDRSQSSLFRDLLRRSRVSQLSLCS